MIRPLVPIGLICLLCVVAVSVWAQDQITETDVVTILNGKPRPSASGHPVGIALHLPFTPMTASEEGGKSAPHDAQRLSDDLLYKTLLPLARALEAGVSTGSRYIVRLSPDSSVLTLQAAKLGQQHLDTVAQFLTTYFTIPPERLSLQLSLPAATTEGQAPPQSASQRWRVDVLRQD